MSPVSQTVRVRCNDVKSVEMLSIPKLASVVQSVVDQLSGAAHTKSLPSENEVHDIMKPYGLV